MVNPFFPTQQMANFIFSVEESSDDGCQVLNSVGEEELDKLLDADY